MKKITRFSVLLVFVFSLFASTGCEKMKDYEDLLLAHAWRWDKITTTSNDENVQAIITLTNALMASAILQFHSDGTYDITLGDEVDTDIWELYNDNEMLLMGEDEMILVKLTKDALVLEGEIVSNQYGTYSTTMYWKK